MRNGGCAVRSPTLYAYTFTSVRDMKLSEIPTPAFVINRHAFEKNCQAALAHARKHQMRFRPHIKTHKTVEGAYIQVTGHGKGKSESKVESTLVSGFVASTLPELAMLVGAASELGGPFRDILFGVPITRSKLPSVDRLRRTAQDCHIHILLDHPQQIRHIEEYVGESAPPNSAAARFTAFLKLDTGYHRAGVPCDARGVEVALQILESPLLKLVGVYSHCGHAYDENDPEKCDAIAKTDEYQVASFLDQLQTRLTAKNSSFSSDTLTVSVGSTPSLSYHKKNDRIKHLEMHPGNYTLYDRQQLWTGACKDRVHAAGRVVATVIGHYEDRNTIMLDAGATALTKDASPQGGMCEITGFPELDCYRMSQEVTLVRPKDPTARFPFADLPMGCTVTLIPNHSCLSAACFPEYYIIDDPSGLFSPEEPVIDIWKPAKYFTLSNLAA